MTTNKPATALDREFARFSAQCAYIGSEADRISAGLSDLKDRWRDMHKRLFNTSFQRLVKRRKRLESIMVKVNEAYARLEARVEALKSDGTITDSQAVEYTSVLVALDGIHRLKANIK